MHFSLHSTQPDHPSTECYFRLETARQTIYSPFYGDQRAAIEAMERLVRRLRKKASEDLLQVLPDSAGCQLRLFGKTAAAVGNFPVFASQEAAYQELSAWQAPARATTFKIIFWEFAEDDTSLNSLRELDLSATDLQYTWREAGSSLLHVDLLNKIGFKPSVGAQANLVRKPCEPIFNALQPFVSVDFPLFKGRKREVEEVHALLRRRPLLLLYGAPRVGKTSLLQCGLANRIAKDAEEMVVIKREEGDLLNTVKNLLKERLAQYLPDETHDTDDPVALAQSLCQASEKRHFLVFDQLEQLFSATVYDEERTALFRFIRELVNTENPLFRVIMVLREGFLAPLADHEEELPALLDNRFRLLPIKEGSMMDATVNLLDVLKTQDKISVDDSRAVSEKVCRQLADEDGNVPAHCLQIYLHQLHQASCSETADGPVPLNTELIDRMGPAEDVISTFYQERLAGLYARRTNDDGTANPLVSQEIEELEASRGDCGCEDQQKQSFAAAGGGAIVAATPPPAGGWGWWNWFLVALPFFPLGMVLAWWLLPAPNQTSSACQLLEDNPGSCADYVSYLCTAGAGDSTVCLPSWLAGMDLNDCEVWRDYQSLQRRESCEYYQTFFEKYRDSGMCLDFVRTRLLDWQCPVFRDTVQLTVRDTIVQRIPEPGLAAAPGGYGNSPVIPGGSSGVGTPPCQLIGTTTYKSVGPLLIMTDALPGGPFRWEDALDACTASGARLPCIGEIDFLIEKIYRDDPARAFAMLAGAGECNLINPAEIPEGRIEFWTATEANDATAWSYYFDTASKTIGRQSATPKSARLPCLCVKKDPQQRGSGLPPCYQKQVDRRPN